MIVIDILLFALLALSLLAATVWKSALWGLSAWGDISVPLAALLAALAVVIFAWRAAVKHHLPHARTRRSSAWYTVIACVVAFAVFWLLRARHDLWGERHTIAAAVENGIVNRPGAPLGTALNWLFYRFMNAMFIWNGLSASALLSALAGVGFFGAAIGAARLFDRGDDESIRGAAAVMLVANGFAVVFFGMGGNAPLASLFALLFMIAALRFLEGEIGLVVPAVLLPVAVFMHLPAIYLVPAFIYLIRHAYRTRQGRRQVLSAVLLSLACWVGLEIASTFVQNAIGPTRYLISLVTDIIHATSNLVYRDAAKHLLTAANGLLVIGPASVAALVLLLSGLAARRDAGDRLREEERLLALCVVPAILLFPLAAKRIDGGLRYDILASTGPAFALYVLCALRRRTAGAGEFRRAAIVLTTLGVFHVLPLIICNVHGGTAERRLLSLPLSPGRGAFIIAERAFERREHREAFEWYRIAIEKDEGNHAAHARLGTIYMKREEYIDAITSYLEAVERVPESREYRILLAEAYIAKNWLEEAIDNLESLTAEYPDSVRFWRRLGYARNHNELYEGAIEAYQRALELESDNEENVRNLTSALLNRGAQLQQAGENEEAKKLYQRVMQLYPIDWRASNNLAVMAMSEGNIGEALTILRSALEKNPFAPQLNLNMGLLLEEMGDDEKALRYLQRSAELDPLHSGAGPHIERLQEKLQGKE